MEKEKRGDNTYKAHVLVFPFPAQGHTNPMFEFSRRLLSKGVKATLVTTRYFFQSIYVAPDNLIHVETISDGYDEGGLGSAESPELYISRFRDVGSKTLSELINKINGDSSRNDPKVTGLIFDGAVPWAFNVAKECGILGAVFFTQSCAVESVYYHVQRGLLPLPVSEPTVSLPGLRELEVSDIPSFVSCYGSYPAFFDLCMDQFTDIDRFDWVLVNSFYELEKETVDWMKTQRRTATIGPTVPSTYFNKRVADEKKDYGIHVFKPESCTCMNWLQDKPSGSVVYVSIGSVAELGREQMEELAWGLKASNCYFLWVVRASEESKLPPDFASGEKGLMVKWCPQLDVLMHESVGCFVTHCRFNSVLEAMCLGVPMVAIPQWSDQPTNAKFVEDVWKVGIRARMDENGIVRRETIEICVKEVMKEEKGEEMKRNAKKWGDLANNAIDVGGSSDKCIDEFVSSLVGCN